MKPDGRSAGRSRLSRLPAVDAVAELAGSDRHARAAVVDAVRDELARLRERLLAGDAVVDGELEPARIASAAIASLASRSTPRLRRVVNATGVVLHTNLGRATLAPAAVEAAALAAAEAVNLEYDLDSGRRGDRDSLVEEHLTALTGAEAATVVNNNAAAVLLALSALAAGREVVVSRGELVEIGGSFRIPDIMAASGAVLREVGTTNRTHVADYERAICPATAVLLKVHASNYRIVGFTSSVGLAELAAISGARTDAGLAVVEDLGSGALVDLSRFGLASEPLVGDSLRAGADLVLASGDKLLGGPQCGIVAGRRALVDRLRRHPLKRALRCDKMTLAALEATLRIYRFSPAPEREIPTLRRLLRSPDELRATGEAAVALLRRRFDADWTFELVASEVEAGSGSQPVRRIASLAVAASRTGASAAAVEREFRLGEPPILGRIERDRFLLDLRSIDDPADLVPARPGGA